MTRYTFDRYATRHDTGYSVSAVADVSGWTHTWFVDPDPASPAGWRIWKPTPSNVPLAISPSGVLGKRVLAVVRATQERWAVK